MDGLALLADLPALPLRLTARAADPVRLPEHAGSSLRGAFGAALKELVCVHPHREACPGCPLEESCAYPALFEPRARPGQPGTVGFTDLPRPYVIRALPPASRAAGTHPPGDTVPPGGLLAWDVTLIGQAIARLPYFVLAWRAAGEQGLGRGRGRFHLEGVEALGPDGTAPEPVWDRKTGRLRPPALPRPDPRPSGPSDRVTLRFLTPTLVKHRGEPALRPEFPVLWRALQLRLSLLRLAHGAGRPEIDFQATIRRAESVTLERWEARELEWERYSRRQDRRVPMQGWMGTARYAGDLEPFLPALRLGSLVGVGDNCTFGQGHYVLLPEEPAEPLPAPLPPAGS